MSKKKRVFPILAAAILIAALLGISGCSRQNKTQSFSEAANSETILNYQQTDNPLHGKKIIFLGSSITYGEAADGYSFVDCLAEEDGIEPFKEAVSGTTLADTGEDSYVQRMKNKIDKNWKADAFICQLSTNDASLKIPLGTISDTKELSDFDTETVLGAIEYIIGYAYETWNCPVIFYANPKYDSEEYEQMVKIMPDIQEKWDIGFIDMYNDEDFNNISAEQKKEYMADHIHPTKQGYTLWWPPYIEKYLIDYLSL